MKLSIYEAVETVLSSIFFTGLVSCLMNIFERM